MAEGNIERKSITLRVGDRGFEVCYTERCKRPGADMYENSYPEWREENYGEKEFEKATKRMAELIAMASSES